LIRFSHFTPERKKMEGRDIRALRKEGLNWDLRKFAEEVGVSTATVRNWEEGRSKPSLGAREKMNKVFDENLKHLDESREGGETNSESPLPEKDRGMGW
jgi:DNA-binding transcriptional regulator YiaG